MTLTLTAAGSFGLHILSMAEASSSVHNTVTNIEYREMSLVPEALTVKYDGGSVEYHLVQVQSSSSAATWRYYAEKPEWLGVSRMFNRRGCVLHTVQRSQKESLRRDQERRDRIAGRISYAAEQRANGTLPGNF
ncbi:hypothetical protein CPB83DRAFT_844606 [Crepidotus variabilis]|uniref:Uncharacterized protein n=1 Tax=Crepidotus variabilis TaxID=179855 RepID=A0A9P6JVV9_9AGAR|nr:hypothetical protein CPB83DRAFT_844606 [Crepidotus variabilis]